jgi:transposase-like protein
LRRWSYEYIKKIFPGSTEMRMVLEQQKEHSSQWAAIQSIAAKLGCTNETLRRWVRQTECDQGIRTGMTSDDRDRLKK